MVYLLSVAEGNLVKSPTWPVYARCGLNLARKSMEYLEVGLIFLEEFFSIIRTKWEFRVILLEEIITINETIMAILMECKCLPMCACHDR